MLLTSLILSLLACGTESTETTETSASTSETTTSTISTISTTTSNTTSTTTETTTVTTLVETEIDPADERLSYIGRWDLSSPSTPSCGWQGSMLRFRFNGTDARVELNPGASTEYFRAIIDSDPATSHKIEVTEGQTDWYDLATDLPAGEHTIELTRETYLWDTVVLSGLNITGNLLDAPGPRPHFIEFYGDSNFAGYSLEHEENNSGSKFIGNYFGVTGIAARMLDADFTNVANSGDTVSGIHGRYDQIEWWDSNNKWDFNKHPTDVVVVNLGANDLPRPESAIRADYHDFLDDLRTTHPDAHIVLFNGWGWDYDEPANYTAEVVEERNDDNMAAVIFPWVFEQWHGCESDQAGMAALLVDHLEDVMGWTRYDSDVVSSYGVAGDVANGGFEDIAPFGGYGWRYKDDAGVERVTDADDAKEGAAYLKLSNGAETHQPQPATGGQLVSASMWIRASTEESKAMITIDFRDQEMWTSPLTSNTVTVDVGTEWAQINHSFTAPNDGGGQNPVFHTRLTIKAGATSLIDVDDIQMTTD